MGAKGSGGVYPRKPAYSLEKVRSTPDDHFEIGSGCIRRTSLDYHGSKTEVVDFIVGVVRALAPADFCHSLTLDFKPKPVRADVYGVQNEEGIWYVKFHMVDDVVFVTSCHEPDPDLALTRVDGRTLRGTKS